VIDRQRSREGPVPPAQIVTGVEVLRGSGLHRVSERPSCLLVNLAGHGFEWVVPKRGWRCVSAESIELAIACLQRQNFELVLVDVQGDGNPLSPYRQLVESYAKARSGLLAVFGRESLTDDEVWARQLGIWFYSSGIPDKDGVGWLCEEAVSSANALSSVSG